MVPIGFSMVAAVVAAVSSSTAPAQPQVHADTRSALSLGSNMFGATGLIVIPTAYTTGEKVGRFSAFYGEEVGVPSLNFGVIKDAEIGLAYVDRDGADSKLIERDFTPEEHRNFVVRKEILWESATASDAEVAAKEIELIHANRSNDSSVGYNKSPKFRGRSA